MKRIVCSLITLLVSVAAFAQNGTLESPTHMSEAVARSFVDRYPDPDVIHNIGATNTIDWQPGYIMFALEHVWRDTGDRQYYDYIKRYVDQHVDADGNVRQFVPDALDHFIPGYVCLLMYETTGEERYAKAAEHFRDGLRDYPRTAEGMFTHNARMRQVWVDGVYMGQMFLARYAKTMNHPEDYAEVVKQITGVNKLCGRPDGLLYHAWAEPGKGRWPGDGASPEVWSEGLGWVAVLLADVFDWMPEDTPGADEVKGMLIRMCAGLKACQDRKTGLWCQVVDKPLAEGNWNESSGSGMFTYLIQKAIDKGFIPADEYQSVVDKAYEGLLTKCVRNSDGCYNIVECSSIGVKSSYEEYISQVKEVSCFTSFASMMLGAGAAEWHRDHPAEGPLSDFYCTDYSGGKIYHFKGGRVAWEHDAPLSNDLWVQDDGSVLFTTGNGVLELSAEGDTLFCYSSDSKIFACQKIAGGNYFVGECSTGRLLEINAKGKTVKSLCIAPEGADDGYIRNARRLQNGHYLVAHYSGKKVIEYDRKGNIVWQADVPGGAHSVARTPSGHTVVSAADKTGDPQIMEFDAKGQLVWTLSNDDFTGEPLKFMSGFQYLPDSDSFVLTNWQGHNVRRRGPDVIWISRDKSVLGTFHIPAFMRTVSSVFVPGTPYPAIH